MSTSTPRNNIHPLTVFQNRFIRNGRPFLFRGIVYQRPYSRFDRTQRSNPSNIPHIPPHLRHADRDVLNDERFDAFTRDVALFEELGVNALWIQSLPQFPVAVLLADAGPEHSYQVTPGVSHERCMSLLAEKEIYVFIGMGSPTQCINRSTLWESYTPALLRRYYSVVDAFQQFDNVAGFVVADQIVNDVKSTAVAAVVRAAIRDVKAYLRLLAEKDGSRAVPVGVSDAEWAILNTDTTMYYTGGNSAESVDFYACINFSSWPCLNSGEQNWSALLGRLKDVSVPVVMSEYGSNITRPRQFLEAGFLYGEQGMEVFSGGLAYEFYEASNAYGLVKIVNDGGEVKKLLDFEYLRTRLEEARKVGESLELPPEEHGSSQMADVPLPLVSRDWLAIAELPESPLSPEEYLKSICSSV